MNKLATLIEKKNDLINQAQASLRANGPNDPTYLDLVKQADTAAEECALPEVPERLKPT